MAKYKFSIKTSTKKPKKPKGKYVTKRNPVAYRRAVGTGEPLRAARMLAGY
jgi:hypothetical protein